MDYSMLYGVRIRIPFHPNSSSMITHHCAQPTHTAHVTIRDLTSSKPAPVPEINDVGT